MTANLEFQTPEANWIWHGFLRRLDWSNRDLTPEEKEEARAEVAVHIRDAMAELNDGDDTGDEFTHLEMAIGSYGLLVDAPPAWRKPLAIGLHYCSILVIGVVGVFVLIFLHMAVMEIFNPEGVGLWIYSSGGFALSYEVQSGATEILGAWFIPTMLGVIGVSVGALYLLWRFALAPSGTVIRWMES